MFIHYSWFSITQALKDLNSTQNIVKTCDKSNSVTEPFRANPKEVILNNLNTHCLEQFLCFIPIIVLPPSGFELTKSQQQFLLSSIFLRFKVEYMCRSFKKYIVINIYRAFNKYLLKIYLTQTHTKTGTLQLWYSVNTDKSM